LTDFKAPLELFSLEEEATLLPGSLFVFGFQIYFSLGARRGASRREGRREQGTLAAVSAYPLLNVICVEDAAVFFRRHCRWEGEMFCDGCGGAVQPGQSFCSKCGKQIVGPVLVAQAMPGRVQQHMHLLGILWLAMSALNAVGGLVLIVVANTLFPHLHEMGAPPEMPTSFLSAIVSTLGIIVLAKAACGFIAGWGLLHREGWGRVVALVLAFISLFNIPFGTAIGVYTMWVLLPAASQQEYDALSEERAA
jgi:hypothetical protein